jgi:splicing factor 3B subunit 3
LAGIGKSLRIYDLGKKKILRKSENKSFPTFIVGLQTQGDRIYVGDIQESIHLVRYIYQENALVVFADDTVPHWMTKFAVLDYNTVCGADKFGNVFVKRLSKEDIEELEDDLSGGKIMHEKGRNQGAPKKVCPFVLYVFIDSCSWAKFVNSLLVI